MSLRDIPNVGDTIGLKNVDGDGEQDVRVVGNYGVARVMAVEDEAGNRGIVAFQPSGKWWWVRPIEPREPWEGDDTSWRVT